MVEVTMPFKTQKADAAVDLSVCNGIGLLFNVSLNLH